MEQVTLVKARRGERGFTIWQVMVTLVVIAIVTTYGVIGMRGVRNANLLQNSARSFASRAEKARLDAVRRHLPTHLEFTSATTYEITMDFSGTGNEQTRSFTLEPGVYLTDANGNAITAEPFPYADFDWRGRTAECSMLFGFKNSDGRTSNVQVAGSGDVTINNVAVNLPNVAYTNVNSVVDVAPTGYVAGTDTKLNLSPCGVAGGGGGGGGGGVPPPVGTGPGNCNLSLTPTTGIITIRRNGGSTGTFYATVNGSGTVTATPDPNLSVTPTTRSVTSSSGATVSFAVRSLNRSRSTYPVTVTFGTCSPTTMYVKVVN
jgi:type II secretory pathway pseudopilin PulG